MKKSTNIHTYKSYINESYSIKKSVVLERDLAQILPKLNFVTIPYFNEEDALLAHIKDNFDKSDCAILYNPPKTFNDVEMEEQFAILYTKKKAYIIKDFAEPDFDRLCDELNIQK